MRLIGGPFHLRAVPDIGGFFIVMLTLDSTPEGTRTDQVFYERRSKHTAVYHHTDAGEVQTEAVIIRSAIEAVWGLPRFPTEPEDGGS